jgi:hypothetical protein
MDERYAPKDKKGPKEKWLIEADDVVICLDAKTGKKPAGYTHLMSTGNRVLLEGNGTFRMFSTAPDFKLLETGKLPSFATCITPALADARLYVRGTQGIYCLDLRK